MLTAIVNVFHQIKDTSSKNDKAKIISDNKDLKGFVEVLDFLYNPYRLTGIKTKKLVKFSAYTSELVAQFYDIFEAMKYLSVNNTGRDKDVMAIANFINQHEGLEHDFLQDLFTKSFKCGITSSTINKVFGKNFIPKFEVQLAKKFEDEEHKLKGEFGVTLKLDGIRAVAIKENGVTSFFTRQGQPIEGLFELEKNYASLPDNMVYDGELLLKVYSDIPSDELFRLTQKAVRKDGVKLNISHILYDIISLTEFQAGKSKKTYADRRLDLDHLEVSEYIEVLPVLYYGKDKAMVFKLLNIAVNNGKEGVMVNNSAGYYVTKRTDNLLKVKKMYTMDLKVADVQEGTGKNAGKLGAIILDYKGYVLGCGSGFTDEQRVYYWENPEKIVGRVVEVQYFEESTNQDGGLSLRFPVFKAVREEGKEVSFY